MSALIYTQMEVHDKKGDGWEGKIISDDVRLGQRRNGLCCDDAGAAPKASQPTESMPECRQPLCGATVPQRRAIICKYSEGEGMEHHYRRESLRRSCDIYLYIFSFSPGFTSSASLNRLLCLGDTSQIKHPPPQLFK